MQDQDPNKPGDDEFLDEFDEFGDFSEDEMAGGFDESDMPPPGEEELVAPEDVYGEEDADADLLAAGEWDEDMHGFDDDEEWAEPGDDDTAFKTKKGISFNTAVIGVALLVGVGVLVFQVVTTQPSGGGGLSRFQSALNFTGSTDGPVLGEEKEKAGAGPVEAPPADAQAGFLNNPAMLNDAGEQADANPPQPAPISNDMDDQGMEQALTPMPDSIIEEESPSALAFDEAQPVPRGPGDQPPADQMAQADETDSPAMAAIRAAQMKQQQAQQETAQTDGAKEAPAPGVSAPPDAIPAEETAALEATPAEEDVAAVQDELPVPDMDVKAEEESPVSVPETEERDPEPDPVDTAQAQANDQLKDALAEARAEMGKMQEEMSALRTARDKEVSALEAEIARLKKEAASAATAPAKKADAKPIAKKEAQPAPKTAATPKKQSAPKKTAPAVSAASWELRAAQPGRAWVSRKGQREMQSIEVGSTLGGIGRITRIEYAGGRWTVFGTQGEIRQ